MERTFVMIKPDGVERRLIGEIIRRFENRGMRLVGLKQVQPTRALAEQHYNVHRSRPFFNELVEFMTAGPVVAMAWECADAIALARRMIGALKPLEAVQGTVRGDYTTDIQRNLVHASDAAETSAAELNLWFLPGELLP